MNSGERAKLSKVLIIGLSILIVLFVGYKVLGIKPIVVISNSMEPSYLTNSIVLIDTKAKFQDIEVGDVVQYKHDEHQGIVHRVFQKSEVSGTVLTSGINRRTNPLIDNWVVSEDMYAGRVLKGFNGVAPAIWFLFGNLVEKNPLHIAFGFSMLLIIVIGILMSIVKLNIILKKRGCVKMREIQTDVYVVTEHIKRRSKPKVKFQGVIGKVLVSAVILSTIVSGVATTPVYAMDNFNVATTITQNYEISVESRAFEVKQTIKAIEDMKTKGVVSSETLSKLANELMSLEQAVHMSGKAVTQEVADTVNKAENVIKGVKGAETVEAIISVVKDSLNITEVSHNITETPAKAAATVTSFSDVLSSHWAYKDIMTLVGKGIISGVTTPVNGVGKYAPNDTVSLGQFLAISTRLVAEDSIKPIANSGHWAAQNYAAAVESGLINSRDFKSTVEALNAGISREDMAYILVSVAKANGETLQIKDGIKNNINDINSISPNRLDAVLRAYSNGLLVGGSGNKFNPKDTLKRSEVAAVFCRVMNYTIRPETVVKAPVKELTGTEQAKEVFNQIPTYNQKTNHGLKFEGVGYTLDDVSTFAFNYLTTFLNYDATDISSMDTWEKELSKYVTIGSLKNVAEIKQELIDAKDKCKVDVYVDASKIEIKEGNFIVHAVVYDYITDKTIKVDARIGGHNVNKSELAVGLWKLTTVNK